MVIVINSIVKILIMQIFIILACTVLIFAGVHNEFNNVYVKTKVSTIESHHKMYITGFDNSSCTPVDYDTSHLPFCPETGVFKTYIDENTVPDTVALCRYFPTCVLEKTYNNSYKKCLDYSQSTVCPFGKDNRESVMVHKHGYVVNGTKYFVNDDDMRSVMNNKFVIYYRAGVPEAYLTKGTCNRKFYYCPLNFS